MSEAAKVLHVLGTGQQHARGIAQTVVNLRHSLDFHRYSLSVIFLEDDGPLGDWLRTLGIPVKPTGWAGGWRDAFGLIRFAQAVRKVRPAVVHLHAGGLSTRLASRLTRARIVVHYHSLEQESGDASRATRSDFGADAVIVNSQATAATVQGRNVTVVYPGVSVPPHLKTTDNGRPLTLGVAARLVRVKGIHYLISTMRSILSEWPDANLQIAGAGPEQSKLERQARLLGVEKAVRFLGWRNDLGSLMSNWDVYVQPSLSEGLGIAVLEAMAAGLPVVVTAVGGLPEIVVDGETGYLVPRENPGALGDRIAELGRNPALRTRLGDAGRERVRAKFSVEHEATAIQAVYSRVLG